MSLIGRLPILFTSDGADSNHYLNGGRCPGCLTNANFGSDSGSNFARVRSYQPEGPDFCMEWWLGWFDHWGEQHHVRNVENAAQELETILKTGANINRANFKSIGSSLLMTRFFVRQNRFGAPTPTFSQKATKNQILGRFPPLL